MKKRNFKIGDRVWFGYKSVTFGTIKELGYKEENLTMCGEPFLFKYDVVVETDDGVLKKLLLKKVHHYDERVEEIHNKCKWSVNYLLGDTDYKVEMDNGYFGSYSIIAYKGKKAVVYCDDRDAKVIMITGFYDDIIKCEWSGDNRWNNDKPCIVYDKELGYNLIEKHTNYLLCDEWLKRIFVYPIDGGFNGRDWEDNSVKISFNGFVSPLVTKEELERQLNVAKQYDETKIIEEWILKDKPCYHIHGLEYKGSRPGKLKKETALEMFKTHKHFGRYFPSAEWCILDCQVALLMRDYANSDYD